MKRLSILGSTGSIGRSSLKIVEMFPDRFRVVALAAKRNVGLLARQIEKFNPELAVVYDETSACELEKRIPPESRVKILFGEKGYCTAAGYDSVDITLTAVVGAAGLMPTLKAIEAGKTIALANKETLVMAGEIVTRKAAAAGVRILPVDSEHSAIFQCLEGHRKADVNKILLTASGGPFLDRPAAEFTEITKEDALKHPNWAMGQKISIDSATLMNKGLEILEAKWLFDISQEMIEVVIQPQSVVHSMVAYRDGSVIAQLGIPDMKGAIAYAFSYPARLPLEQPLPDFSGGTNLTFRRPDLAKFPCLTLAYKAGDLGGTLPAVMNAANEEAVHEFLGDRLTFTGIPEIIKNTMDRHKIIEKPELADIVAADEWARNTARELISIE